MTAARRVAVMLALVVAGEAVFGLPFVLARVFRPTLLDVFGLTNLEFGIAFSVYGVVAMISYFVGGPLADRFSARRLMTIALLATAAGGPVFASIPSNLTLRLLYAWWGLTTVLLFWAPLIRAAREWGGGAAQGRAYGLLDGGRGLFSAVLGSVAVSVFAAMLPLEVASASLEERRAAFIGVVWLFTALTVVAAILVWLAVPEPAEQPREDSAAATEGGARELDAKGGALGAVLRMPVVWLQAMIVVCAYIGYKSTDDLSLYARDAFGYDDVGAARIGTLALWVRPFAAIAAGVLADRIEASRATVIGFALMAVASLAIALGVPRPETLLVVSVIAVSAGVNALRGVYFALLAEGRVPLAYTGTAVGVVSFIGYTPDVFMGPLMGVLLDRSPGALGHQHLFAVVALAGAVGLVCALAFRRVARSAALDLDP